MFKPHFQSTHLTLYSGTLFRGTVAENITMTSSRQKSVWKEQNHEKSIQYYWKITTFRQKFVSKEQKHQKSVQYQHCDHFEQLPLLDRNFERIKLWEKSGFTVFIIFVCSGILS